jgi:hypothetical protein
MRIPKPIPELLGLIGFLFLIWSIGSLLLSCCAWPHDHWIAHGYYAKDGSGQSCCGPEDCAITNAQHVTLPTEGFRLPSGEYIPRNQVQASRDEYSWVCRRKADDSIRCFFAPSSGDS